MSMTDYLENALLDHVFNGVTYTPPTTVYVALYTVAPGDAGGGTEMAGGSYARQAVTFDAASGGSVANDTLITFTDVPAATVVAAALLDASSGGNMLMTQVLPEAKAYTAGEDVTIDIGDLLATFG